MDKPVYISPFGAFLKNGIDDVGINGPLAVGDGHENQVGCLFWNRCVGLKVLDSMFQQEEILRLAEEAHNEALIFKQLTALRAEYNQAKSEQILVQAKVAQ